MRILLPDHVDIPATANLLVVQDALLTLGLDLKTFDNGMQAFPLERTLPVCCACGRVAPIKADGKYYCTDHYYSQEVTPE
jgi:hypothetical protein